MTSFAGTPAVLELPAADGSRGTIQVDSFSWGVHKAGAGATGTSRVASSAGAGKVNVQDLSVTRAATPAPVAATSDGTAPPPVGSTTEVSFGVDPAASPAAAGLVADCAKGKHFDEVVIVVNGQKRVAQDATFTCSPPSAAARQREFRGHVTLMK